MLLLKERTLCGGAVPEVASLDEKIKGGVFYEKVVSVNVSSWFSFDSKCNRYF